MLIDTRFESSLGKSSEAGNDCKVFGFVEASDKVGRFLTDFLQERRTVERNALLEEMTKASNEMRKLRAWY
jgi:hypothetical protein